MRLTAHIISSLVLAIILFPFFGPYSFLVLISGFLIDIDHPLDYMFRFKRFSLKCHDYYKSTLENRDVNRIKNNAKK